MIKHSLTYCIVAAFILAAGTALAAQMPEHANHNYVRDAASGSSHADVEKHNACPHCGMDREKFAYSRVLVTYSDGSSGGLCSIHCLVTELKGNNGKPVKVVEVADLNTKKLVDAEKATWVIGGSKKGVMTRVAKWAFAKKEDAVAFIQKNGGTLATYKEALALAGKD